MDVFTKAVKKLTDQPWRLNGEPPTSESEFLSRFKIGVGTDEQGSQIYSDDPTDFGFTWDQLNTQLQTEVADPANQPFHAVSKLTIIARLEAEGKFNAALAALKQDEAMYEKWSAVSELRSTDQNAIALFAAIGCDPAVILAEELPA